MRELEILPYCAYYKGEALMPKEYENTDEGGLWYAEMMLCTDLQNLFDYKHPEESVADAIYSYLGKWAPYDAARLMDIYIKNNPKMKKFL